MFDKLAAMVSSFSYLRVSRRCFGLWTAPSIIVLPTVLMEKHIESKNAYDFLTDAVALQMPEGPVLGTVFIANIKVADLLELVRFLLIHRVGQV